MILEMFWTVLLIKSPRVLWWSWILNECNLSCKKKIGKYCILYEVCMIKTAPHSNLSPQMWYITNNKRLVCTHPDLLARICKLVERKKIGLICFPRICFPRLIYCDQEPLLLLNVTGRLFFGCRYKAISTRYKICFTPKSLSFSLQSHMNVPLS